MRGELLVCVSLARMLGLEPPAGADREVRGTVHPRVLVMSDDPQLREARLALLKKLHDTVLQTGGDISEIAPQERSG